MDRLQEQSQQAQAAAHNSQNQDSAYAPSFTSYQGSSGSIPLNGGSIAAASLGPEGGTQTAAVFPENPVRNSISYFRNIYLFGFRTLRIFLQDFQKLHQGMVQVSLTVFLLLVLAHQVT